MKEKFAQFFSLIGHPLITIPIVVSVCLFYFLKTSEAVLASGLIILFLIVPLTIHMYRKSRSGVYANFDVSNQGQRQHWYVYVFLLMCLVTIVLYFTTRSLPLKLGFLLAGLLLLSAQLLNYIIKSSLHASLNVFLAFLLAGITAFGAFLFLIFTGLVSWSRWQLGRHTLPEILAGWVLGLVYGSLLWWFTK